MAFSKAKAKANAMKLGVLVMALTATLHAADAPLIEVTGNLLSVNGTTEVPLGLFGVHATPLDAARIADWGVTALRVIERAPDGVPLVPGVGTTPAGLAQVVECVYDRYQPALLLTDPQWQRTLTSLAQRYAAAAARTGAMHHIEFWNEPYLNWSCKPGVNYDAVHYDSMAAADGAAVTIRGQAQATEFLRWTRGLRAVEVVPGSTPPSLLAVAAGRAPTTAKTGDTYDFRGQKFRMEESWMAKDPTQQFYWAGQQNALWYRRMFVVFARALKAANPAVQVSAGWGFNMWNEDWAAWRQLYQPLIDEALPLMDGVHEHHYGGETRLVAASYEVATAYTAERGKRLHFYNTEAGGMLDPERPDTPSSAVSGTPVQRAQGAMTYFLRDVIHLLDICPDKAFARAAHEADQNGGDEFAFKLLKPLRGRLISCRTSSTDMWCVASLHDQTLTVVCFNDGRRPIRAPLLVNSPHAMHLTAGTVLGVAVRSDAQGLELTSEALAEVADTQWHGVIDLPMKGARTLVFTLSGTAPEEPQTLVTQHFAPGILGVVTPTAALQRTITLPQAALATATRARLKLVVLDHDGHGMVTVNGHQLQLRSGSCTVLQDLDPTLLTPTTTLDFAAQKSGYRVLMASIELITER